MTKTDVDLIFSKYHFQFSLKLIFLGVVLFGVGTYTGATPLSLTIAFFGSVLVLLMNLFKKVLTELFTSLNDDETLSN